MPPAAVLNQQSPFCEQSRCEQSRREQFCEQSSYWSNPMPEQS
jgi:hypothetical protein